MKTVLVIIKNEKNEILFLLRAKKPFGWALPGGKVKDDESEKDGLIREVLEETGIDLSSYDLHFVKSDTSIDGTSVDIYSVQLTETPTVKINKSEHLNKRWFSGKESESKDLIFAGNTRRFIMEMGS